MLNFAGEFSFVVNCDIVFRRVKNESSNQNVMIVHQFFSDFSKSKRHSSAEWLKNRTLGDV